MVGSAARRQRRFHRMPSPVSCEMGAPAGTLPGRAGDNFPRVLVVGDALFDFKHEPRRVALDHLPDARPKLVEDVHPRVAANRRTKIVERRRSGARPIWTRSIVDSDRTECPTECPKEIRSVQPPLSRVVTRDENARSCVGGPAHNAAAGRRAITEVLLEQRRIQVLTKKGAGFFLHRHQFKEGGKAGL